ncbi:MAG TPA: hypothetical protein VMI72_00905, partial [Roseiarcus sp.]|nr:hypothetical protein [Roseiarcus sp.]
MIRRICSKSLPQRIGRGALGSLGWEFGPWDGQNARNIARSEDATGQTPIYLLARNAELLY